VGNTSDILTGCAKARIRLAVEKDIKKGAFGMFLALNQ